MISYEQVLAERTERTPQYHYWEEQLRLILKPKPRFLPTWIWKKIVNLVVVQQSKWKRI